MRRFRFPFVAALVAIVALASGRVRADDTFVWSRFEQYLEALRQQAGIAGLSGIVLKDGRIVWERGFGFQDIEAGIRTTPEPSGCASPRSWASSPSRPCGPSWCRPARPSTGPPA